MKGIYVLIIQVEENIDAKVGSLGKILFEKGLYAYVGSAQNNLEKRVERHFRKDKKKFWHIDYLLGDENAKIVGVFIKEGSKKDECRAAKKIWGMSKPIKGFGSSDCKCESHLFKLNDYNLFIKIFEEDSFLKLELRERQTCK